MTNKITDSPFRVLLIESDPTVRQPIVQALDRAAYPSRRVRTADTLSQGIAALTEPDFDAVLLGLHLSDSAGITTMEKIRRAAGHLPAIIIYDGKSASDVARAAQNGAMGIIHRRDAINASKLNKCIRFAVARSKKELKLIHKERKYRRFIETLKDAYYEIDLDGVFTYANDASLSHIGRTWEEAIGTSSSLYNYSPEEYEKIKDIYVEIYNTGRSGKIVNTFFPREDGSLTAVEMYASLLRDDQGNPIGFSGISRDVTEQWKIQKMLIASKDRHQTILESIEDTYFEVDLNGRITFFNRTADGLYGYSLEELLEMNSGQFMDTRNAKKAYEAYYQVYQTGEPNRSLQFEVIQKDGSRIYIESSISLMLDSQNRRIGFHGVGRNITERKAKERELIRAKERAEAATRAKSEFLANMSHEIRTPMNGIIGMYNLLHRTPLDPAQTDYVETGKRSAERLLAVIDDILDYSKIEAGKLEIENINFNLHSTIEQLTALPASQARAKGLGFTCRIDPAVPLVVKGDANRLSQIVTNLATNGIKFTCQGEVGLFVDLEEETPTHVRIRLSVKDTGIGICHADQVRLFKSFQQVDYSSTRRYEGAGLGLAIASRLTDMMNGTMGVDSVEGAGSTFWSAIGLEKADGAVDEFSAAPESIRNKRILLVDDNPADLDILEGYLNMWGCHSDRASNAEMALKLMQAVTKTGAPYDLMICDLLMPVMDGIELGKAVKADPALKDTLMIMLTSCGLRGDAAEMKRIGFCGYLTKPVNPSGLFDCMTTVINRYRAAQHPGPKPGPNVEPPTLSRSKQDIVRVLLAEDNPVSLKVALHLLKQFGYKTDAVNSGKAALEALSKKPYDVVLMDVQMPEMDGYEATRIVRLPGSPALNPNIPIIAMTALADRQDRDACLAAGMDAHISKPIEPNLLKQIIEQMLVQQK